MEFQDLRGLTLLSFKYDVQHIQSEVVRRLRVCFPSNLQEWDLRYPNSYKPPPKLLPTDSPVHPENTLNFKPIDSIAVINLARRFNLNELLPAAFYICCMQPWEDIVARVRYNDSETEDVEEIGRAHV